MGNGSPTRLQTLCVVIVAAFGLAGPAHAGDLLATPAPVAAPTVASVAPAAETLAATVLPAVETPSQPTTPLPNPTVEDVSRALTGTGAAESLPQVPQLLPRAAVSGGILGAARTTLRSRSPHRAKAAAAPQRRVSVQPPVRIVVKQFAAPRSSASRAPAPTVVDRLQAGVAPAALPEPAANGDPGEPAAAGSGSGSGAVGALLLATIVLGLVHLGLRIVPAGVRPHGYVSRLQLERPG
jgi:hypothetical protein